MDQEDVNVSREESTAEANKLQPTLSENNLVVEQTVNQESRTLLPQRCEDRLQDFFSYHNTSLEESFLFAEVVGSDTSNASGDQSNESDDSGSVEYIESKKRLIDIDSDDSSEVEVGEPLPFLHSSFVEQFFSFGNVKKRKVDVVEQSIQTENQNDSIPWDAECVICFDSMKPEEAIVRLPCRHFYHFSCIGRYFNSKMREISPRYECPMCREKYKGEWKLPESQSARHEASLSDLLSSYHDASPRPRQRRPNTSALGSRTRLSTRRGAANTQEEPNPPVFQSPPRFSSHESSVLLPQDNDVREPYPWSAPSHTTLLSTPTSLQWGTSQISYLTSTSQNFEEPVYQNIIGNAPPPPLVYPLRQERPAEQPPPWEYPTYMMESSRSEVSLSRVVAPLDPVLAPETGLSRRSSLAVSNSLAPTNAPGTDPWHSESPLSRPHGHHRTTYQPRPSRGHALVNPRAPRDLHSVSSSHPTPNQNHSRPFGECPYLAFNSSSSSHGTQPTSRPLDPDQPSHVSNRVEPPPLPLPSSSLSSFYLSFVADGPDLLENSNYFDETDLGGL